MRLYPGRGWSRLRRITQRPARMAAACRPRRRPSPARPVPAGVLGRSRGLALWAIAALVAAASLVSFAESYRALYEWAAGHGLSGRWAVIWPLQVDVFIAVGELALFVALADGWQLRSRIGAWLVTLAGLAVSVAGNVGHVASHALANRATAAVPPLAAASALAVGLGVLKRVVEHRYHQADSEAAAAQIARDAEQAAPASGSAPVPSLRQLQRELRVGAPKARQVQALIRTSMNGHASAPRGGNSRDPQAQ